MFMAEGDKCANWDECKVWKMANVKDSGRTSLIVSTLESLGVSFLYKMSSTKTYLLSFFCSANWMSFFKVGLFRCISKMSDWSNMPPVLVSDLLIMRLLSALREASFKELKFNSVI